MPFLSIQLSGINHYVQNVFITPNRKSVTLKQWLPTLLLPKGCGSLRGLTPEQVGWIWDKAIEEINVQQWPQRGFMGMSPMSELYSVANYSSSHLHTTL